MCKGGVKDSNINEQKKKKKKKNQMEIHVKSKQTDILIANIYQEQEITNAILLQIHYREKLPAP